MAGVKISELPAATTPLAGTELLAVVQGGVTKQVAIGGTIPASQIINTPSGTVAATNVQGAINEIVSDLAASSGSSLVGFVQSGTGAVTRTAQSKMRDAVSVKDFGAVGDGVADDTVAIQAALDSVGVGGTVNIPAGTYKTTAALNVKKAIIVSGASMDGTIINNTGVGNSFYLRDTTVPTYTNGAVLQNMTIQGSASAAVGIYCDPITYCKFLNLNIKNHGSHGILLNGSYFNQINGCDIRSNTGYGIVVQNSSNANTIVSTSTNYNGSGGLRFYNSNGLTLVQFDTEANTGWGIVIEAAAELYMTGGWNEGNTIGGIRAFSSSERCEISGSFRVVGSTPAIKLESTSFFTIANARCASLIDIDAGCSNTKIYGLLAAPFVNNFSTSTFLEGLPLATGNSATGPAGLQIPFGNGSLKTITWTGTSAVSTGIGINPGDGGKGILAIYSMNAGSGNTTASSVYMIRTGHSGNNFTATKIAGDNGGTGSGSDLVFSQSGGILQVQQTTGANNRLAMLITTPN